MELWSDLTIVIPVKNGEVYIGETINSVGSIPGAKVLLIDNGSSDDTISEAKKAAKKSGIELEIALCDTPGVSSARNMGISLTKTDLLMFIDSDDVVCGNQIEDARSFVNQSDVDVVYIGKNNITDIVCLNDETRKSLILNQVGIQSNSQIGNYLPSTGVCSAIYQTNFLKENDIVFPEKVSKGEDALFNIKLITKCKTIAFIQGGFYKYRQHEDSVMHKVNYDILENHCMFMRLINQYIGHLCWDELNTLELKCKLSDLMSAVRHNQIISAKQLKKMLYTKEKIEWDRINKFKTAYYIMLLNPVSLIRLFYKLKNIMKKPVNGKQSQFYII
ncbi:glycosyltransferase family 2 protein [Weissella cibaria]|uniref:glycosyltransferase family 2 protein n=1 Tax=Weissella cibaria TaxID=137591 RepID=UPI00223BB466|nr:glycosyltransferase family A protein [Weissella cibaria]MCT0021407.1 glycosyltransferase family 2 protein [Weissella cibaria]